MKKGKGNKTKAGQQYEGLQKKRSTISFRQ
jgi:hypothetical protein